MLWSSWHSCKTRWKITHKRKYSDDGAWNRTVKEVWDLVHRGFISYSFGWAALGPQFLFGNFSETEVCLWSKQQVLGKSGQSWRDPAALHQPGPAKIPVNQDKSTSQASQPVQQLPSSAQATAEAGEQLWAATSSAAEEHPGQQEASSCWTGCHSPAVPQPGTPRGQPACPALPGRDAWLCVRT